jgi:hypothetical protein
LDLHLVKNIGIFFCLQTIEQTDFEQKNRPEIHKIFIKIKTMKSTRGKELYFLFSANPPLVAWYKVCRKYLKIIMVDPRDKAICYFSVFFTFADYFEKL